MERGFRQSMTWLHTWAGLLVGWVLFFVFLTGTLGYVNAEIDRWMRPELPIVSKPVNSEDMLPIAEARLQARAPRSDLWQIVFPNDRGPSVTSVGWREPAAPGARIGTFRREALNTDPDNPNAIKVRDTGGGSVLYRMHYQLHYMPRTWGVLIVGVCTMFMLTAIFTGIVTHKRFFKDFFTFRPAKGQRSWLDGHTVLAVTALPFHIMITWSGLVFFLFTYMPIGLATLYPNAAARSQFTLQAYGLDSIKPAATRHPATLASLERIFKRVEDQWGRNRVAIINVENPNLDNARVTFYSRAVGVSNPDTPWLRFDGVTGTQIPLMENAPHRFNGVLLGLHEGRFAGSFLRLLYVLAGLVGTAMIGTGLVLWSAKRKAKLRTTDRPHFGIAVVDVLNLGTIIGLPIGIAAFFWANRLLPVEFSARAAWEVHVMFMAWALTFIYAAARPLRRAWTELCWVAAAACALLPLLNALTTDRHLGISIPAGDWKLASIDLGMLAVGLFLVFLASKTRRYSESLAGTGIRLRPSLEQLK